MTKLKQYLFATYLIAFFTFIGVRFLDFNPLIFFFTLQDGIRSSYQKISNNIGDNLASLTSSIDYQERYLLLKEENNKLNLTLSSTLSYLNQMIEASQITFAHPGISKAKMISYIHLMNYDKIWLEGNQNQQGHAIYGLVQDDYAIGIAINKNNKTMGILNNNKDCSYSVQVGLEKALGVLSGEVKNSKMLLVDYIPLWNKIQVGDQVSTSGKDNIFFQGIKVGKVKEISQSGGYQQAIIEPYFSSNHINYYVYMIDTQTKLAK